MHNKTKYFEQHYPNSMETSRANARHNRQCTSKRHRKLNNKETVVESDRHALLLALNHIVHKHFTMTSKLPHKGSLHQEVRQRYVQEKLTPKIAPNKILTNLRVSGNDICQTPYESAETGLWALWHTCGCNLGRSSRNAHIMNPSDKCKTVGSYVYA